MMSSKKIKILNIKHLKRKSFKFRSDNTSLCFLAVLLICQPFFNLAQASLAETLKKVKSSVVAVGTFHPTRHPRAVFLGTGFSIADGSLIATNAHVIPKSLDVQKKEEIAVYIKENNKDMMSYAKLIAFDYDHDLAILKLSGRKLPPLSLGNVNKVEEGRSFAFTGYPIGMVLGLYPVTHQGIISAITPLAIPVQHAKDINKKILKRLNDPYKVFQLDATAYPGNSGSPLYDINSGKVIGIINKVFVKETKEMVLSKPSGITYAIPIHHLKKLLGTIK